MIGLRFREIRAAKLFARAQLASGVPARQIMAAVHEACRRSPAPLPPAERALLTDLVMSAAADAIADWKAAAPAHAPDSLAAWIEQTVASNRTHVRVGGTRGQGTSAPARSAHDPCVPTDVCPRPAEVDGALQGT
jgi:hypothetical protein